MRNLNKAYIIDDDPIFQMGIQEHAKNANFCKDILFFENGKEAYDALLKSIQDNSSELPDVIMVDLNMPIMDGWEFLSSLEQLNLQKHILVHIISSSIDPDDINRAREYDIVSRFISKPILREDLIKIKQEALGN